MTWVESLQAAVAVRYDALALPAWPPPRPMGAQPREEEYSRVTDPGRSRIVHERARAWTAELAALAGVRVERLSPSGPSWDRGVRIHPPRAGTLPLLLLERDVPAAVGAASLSVLTVAVFQPDVVVTSQPDCGCDACDSGSVDLLEAVDQEVRRIVGGPFVVLTGPGWQALWSPDRAQASNLPGGREAFREISALGERIATGEVVRLPEGTRALVGRAWVG